MEERKKYWWEPIVSSITYWVGMAIIFLICIGIGSALMQFIIKLLK
jgi:hypothetical protein